MRKTTDVWLDAYAVSHQNSTNKLLHWVCVPAIVVSVVGILWALPTPAKFAEISPWVNWGTLFLALSAAYYFVLSIPLALGMLPVIAAIIAIVAWMASFETSLLVLSVIVFVVAWVGQFIGHKIEGKKPSFFEDVQFLMIGPLWILAAVFRRFGLRY